MITLLIIADDFTGALDTGVQFAASGAATRVVTDINYDYSHVEEEVRVLVMDAETRHLESKEAYDIVYNITKKAVQHGVSYIYKKTDSALRGNVGSELAAVLDATSETSLSFLPAFPKMGRITKDGILYIDGVLVEESVFGIDPYEPVTCSYIPDLIHQQSQIKVRLAGEDDSLVLKQESSEIVLWDAETDEQMEDLGNRLYKEEKLHIMAGCAGFAAVLPKLLGLDGTSQRIPEFVPKFLVVCGSVNPITVKQLNYAESHDFLRIRMNPEEKLKKDYWISEEGRKKLDYIKKQIESAHCSILDSNDLPESNSTIEYAKENQISTDEIRVCIAENLGYILDELIRKGLECTFMITGGDTLLGCMKQMDVYEMEPVSEMAPGIVLSRFYTGNAEYYAISKSGGFGGDELLTELAEQILRVH